MQEIPESTFTAATALLLCLLLLALLVARMITPLERRLVTSTAVLLAGIFLVGRAGAEPVVALTGTLSWALGLGAFVRSAVCWTAASASRAGPFAVLFLLPPAFFGAVLVGGLIISLFGV